MIILDASVVVKWFSEEEYTEKALEIRERIMRGEERVVVPDLLLYEQANALKYKCLYYRIRLHRFALKLFCKQKPLLKIAYAIFLLRKRNISLVKLSF